MAAEGNDQNSGAISEQLWDESDHSKILGMTLDRMCMFAIKHKRKAISLIVVYASGSDLYTRNCNVIWLVMQTATINLLVWHSSISLRCEKS